jgi:hypothetical protein
MTADLKSFWRYVSASKYLLMLVTLIFTLLVVPQFEPYPFGRFLIYSGITAVLLSGVRAHADRPRLFVVEVLLGSISIPVIWMTMIVTSPMLFAASCVAGSICLALTGIAILERVLKHHAARLESIFGAVSVYLLFGLAWALLYWALDRLDGDSFSMAHQLTIAHGFHEDPLTSFSQLIYFSFVTMSTLGYGDITPTSSWTQSLTWIEAVAGQFYVTILVAWLVSALPRPRLANQADPGSLDGT